MYTSLKAWSANLMSAEMTIYCDIFIFTELSSAIADLVNIV